MDNFPTLKEYLLSHDLDKNADPKLISKHKTQYRKAYLKEYRKQNMQAKKRFTICLEKDEFDKIHFHMKKHNEKSIASFITQSAKAYVEQNYLYPDAESRTDLLNRFTQIANNIGSLCTKIRQHLLTKNLDGELDDSVKNLIKLVAGYEIVLTQIESLEQLLKRYMHTPPPKLLHYNWEEIRDDKVKLKEVITYLLKHLDTSL